MKKNNYYLLIICGFAFAWLAGCNKNYGLKFDNGYTGTDFPDTLNVEVDTSVKVDKSKYIQASVFPGLISPDEPRLQNYVVNIDLNYVDVPASALRISVAPGNWLSTGVWAPAGELVTVEVPAGVYGLEAQIGSHTDNLTGKPDLKRDPLIYNRRQLFPGRNYLRNLYGGLIYIIPSKPTGAVVPLSFSGVARSASFFLGKTTDAEWKELVRKTSVPFFELVGKRIVFTLETAKLAQVSINSPDELMRLWDNTIKEVYWNWYGLEEGNPDVKNRAPFNQWRIVHDIQPSVGAQHSGFPVVAMNTMNYFRQAVVPDEVKTQNWGTFHELGHNMQMHSTWTFAGNGEVSNNLFNFKNAQLNNVRHSNELRSWNAARPYVQKDTLSKRWDGTALWPGGTAAPTNPTDDAKMSFYTQIFEKYGYEFMTYLCTAARNARFTAIDEQSKVDFYYERLCEFTKTDMYRFMREWGLTVSQTSKNSIAAKGYPKLRTNLWMYNPYTRTGGDSLLVARKDVASTGWTVSASTEASNFPAVNMLDGNSSTFWHVCYSPSTCRKPYPHTLTFVSPGTITADGFYFQGRPSYYTRYITDFRIEIRNSDGDAWQTVPFDVGTTLEGMNNVSGKYYITFSDQVTRSFKQFRIIINNANNQDVALAELGAWAFN
ncbi:MAG: M60 family metallopeptidase [Niabella sp.]|nr:M60 family metallopeptidase [Niabella sp.]